MMRGKQPRGRDPETMKIRAKVFDDGDALRIVIPARRGSAFVMMWFFAVAFLLGWIVAAASVLSSLLGHQPIDPFLFPWLAGSTLPTVALLFLALSMLLGRDVLTVDGASMTATKVYPILRHVRRFDADEIRDLHASQALGPGNRFWRSPGEDYGLAGGDSS